jgi:3-phosphoshikimate 1-carboxyvinyltransferase
VTEALRVRGGAPLNGEAEGLPGDKSIGHRALLFSAITDGRVTLRGLGRGEDNRRTREILRQLGVNIEARGEEVMVQGVGLGGLKDPSSDLDCGNSGTTMRLVCGLLAGAQIRARLVGDEYLHLRPMKRVVEPLLQMGAGISGQPGKKPGEIYPPLEILPRGPLAGIDFQSRVSSAQVKSALLIAGLFADGATRVTEPTLSRDHTERMLAAMGAPITVRGNTASIDPAAWAGSSRLLHAERIEVPKDLSAAAFFLAAATLVPDSQLRLPGVGINPTRTGFLDALLRMGGRVRLENERSLSGEKVADLVCESASLSAIEVAGELTTRAIDELPILAVLAAFADGETTIADAAELRVKESDRIATTCALLRAFGVEAEERPDGMRIRGGTVTRPGRVDSRGDHRIAMSGVVCALAAAGESTILDTGNIDTSFPGFAHALGALGATIS